MTLGLSACSSSDAPQQRAPTMQALAVCRINCGGGITTPGGSTCVDMLIVPCERTSASVQTTNVILDSTTVGSIQSLDLKLKEAFGQGIASVDLTTSNLTLEHTDAFRLSVGGEIVPEVNKYSALLAFKNSPSIVVTFTGKFFKLNQGYNLIDVSGLTISKSEILPSTGRIRTIVAEPTLNIVSAMIANPSATDLVAYSLNNPTQGLSAQAIGGTTMPYMNVMEQLTNKYDTIGALSVDPRCYIYGPPAPESLPIVCPNPLPPQTPQPTPTPNPIPSCTPVPSSLTQNAYYAAGEVGVAVGSLGVATREAAKSQVGLLASRNAGALVANVAKWAVAKGLVVYSTKVVGDTTAKLDAANQQVRQWYANNPNHC